MYRMPLTASVGDRSFRHNVKSIRQGIGCITQDKCVSWTIQSSASAGRVGDTQSDIVSFYVLFSLALFLKKEIMNQREFRYYRATA